MLIAGLFAPFFCGKKRSKKSHPKNPPDRTGRDIQPPEIIGTGFFGSSYGQQLYFGSFSIYRSESIIKFQFSKFLRWFLFPRKTDILNSPHL